MTPIEQTVLTMPGADCYRAALASLFDVPLQEVPALEGNEGATQEGWDRYRERVHRLFLEPRGYIECTFECEQVPHPETGEMVIVAPRGYALLGAQSPRTFGMHCVVCYDGVVVWDPHPDRAQGLGKWHDWTQFVAIDPAKLQATNPTDADQRPPG